MSQKVNAYTISITVVTDSRDYATAIDTVLREHTGEIASRPSETTASVAVSDGSLVTVTPTRDRRLERLVMAHNGQLASALEIRPGVTTRQLNASSGAIELSIPISSLQITKSLASKAIELVRTFTVSGLQLSRAIVASAYELSRETAQHSQIQARTLITEFLVGHFAMLIDDTNYLLIDEENALLIC